MTAGFGQSWRSELRRRPDLAMRGRSRGAARSPRQCQVFVRKVVPTLTSKSAEIYLSMAGAKQLVTLGLSGVAASYRPVTPQHQGWRCSARDGVVMAGMAAQD
jgi:hypothetical protein